ncbi:MAG: acetylxylan esterase, partial [Kiritimatiellia bacterium]
ESLSTRKAVLVHASGTELVIESTTPRNGKGEPPAFTAGTVTHPSRAEVLALVFDTPGFKANPFRLSFETEPRGPSRMGKAHFDVYSSDDPADFPRVSGGVATFGVVNPEYSPDTELDYGFVFEWKGPEPFEGHAELEVIHAYRTPHYFGKVDLSGKEPGQITGKFNPQFTLPGVSEVWLRIVDGEGRMLWNDRYRMMYDRENFEPNLLVEDDFESFWKETLGTLAEIPLEPETVRVEKYKDVPDFEIYGVSFTGWEGKRFHAMMYVPREGERPLPAIVTAHPGTRGFRINKGKDGVFGSDIREDKRFVTIIPLIRGHEIDAPDVPFNPPWWGPLEDRDTYVARSWYTAMVRAVDYLATRPDLVDMNRIVAAGGSQGGALAIVTAALDPRILACFADCPSNAQPHEIMRYYESFGPSFGVIPEGSSREEVEKLLSYYNPANFAPLIQVPTHVGINIGDVTVHAMGPLSIYKNLTALDESQKAFHPGFSHFHGSGPGLTRERNAFYKQITK